MPVARGRDSEGPFFRWGETGFRYRYSPGDKEGREAARESAARQGRAIKANSRTGGGAIELEPPTAKGKRFSVVYDGRRVNFGAEGGTTYADGASDAVRAAWLKRHGAPAAGEDWTDPTTAGFWSRWILWEKRSPAAGLMEALRRIP